MPKKGYKQTQDHIDKIRKTRIGIKRPNHSKRMMGSNNPFYKKKHTSKTKKILFDKKFEGGNYIYWHNKVWSLYGKNYCELCGISLKDYKKKLNRRLSMHCRDNNCKNILEDNWITVCEFGCHQKMDKLDR